MQFNLVPHPATPPAKPTFNLWASVDHAASLGPVATTNIWFGVGAPAERFVIPELSEPWRAEGLWQTTCFEAFLRPAPISTIGLCQACCSRRSIMICTTDPTCRLRAVASKP